jgi:hypothetical protein
LVVALATFALTEALVADLITPIIAAIIGQPNFADLHFTINGSVFKYQELKGASAKSRPCPECTTAISIAARRCPACTAVVIRKTA